MKRFYLFLLALIIPCAVFFAGCGTDPIVGEWKTYQIKMGDAVLNLEDEFEGGEVVTEDLYVIVFNSNGTFSLSSTMSEGLDNVIGTWAKGEGSKYILTPPKDEGGEEDAVEVEIKEGKLYFNFTGDFGLILAK